MDTTQRLRLFLFLLGYIQLPCIFAKGGCPAEFMDMSSKSGRWTPMCMLHVSELATWDEALKYCNRRGADLATALTRKDMATILRFMHNPPSANAVDIEENGRELVSSMYWVHWLGATNRFRDGAWRWIVGSNAKPMKGRPQYWSFHEPTGTGVCLTTTAGEPTLHNIDNYDRWVAQDCYIRRPFMCQIRY